MREVLVLCLLLLAWTTAEIPEERPVEIDTVSFHDDGVLAQDDNYSDHHEMPEVPSGSEDHAHKAAPEYSQQDITHTSSLFRTLNERPEEYNYPEHPPPDYTKEPDDYEDEFDMKIQREQHYPHGTYERHDYVSAEGTSSSEERMLDEPSTHRGRKYRRYEGFQGHSDELDHRRLHSENSEENHEQSNSQIETSEEGVRDEHTSNESGSHADESQENDSHEGEKHNENSHSEVENLETGSSTQREDDESVRNESGSDDSESGESKSDENESAEHHARYTHYHRHNHHDNDQDVHKMLHHHFHLIIPKHHVEDLFSQEEDKEEKTLLGFQFFGMENHNMMDDHNNGDDGGAGDSSSHKSEIASDEGNSSEELSHIADHSSYEEASFDNYPNRRYESHEYSSEHSDSRSDEHSDEHSDDHSDEHSDEHSNEHSDEHSAEHSDEHSNEHSDEHSNRYHFHYGRLSDESSEEESSEEYPEYNNHHGSSSDHQDHRLHSDYHHYHHDRHPHYQKIHHHEDDFGRSHHHDSHTGWSDEARGNHLDIPTYRNPRRNHYSERSGSLGQSNESDESTDEIHRGRTGHSHDHGERAHHENENWRRDSEEASGSIERDQHGGLSGVYFHKHGDWEHRRHNSHHLVGLHTSEGHPERHRGHHARNFRFHPIREDHSQEDSDRARLQKVGHFETRQFQDWHRSNPLGHHGRVIHHHDLNDEDGGHGFSHRGSQKSRHQHLHIDLDNTHGQRDLLPDRQDTSSPESDDGDKFERVEKLPDVLPADEALKDDHHGVNDEDYNAKDDGQDHSHEDHSIKTEDAPEEVSSNRNRKAGGTVRAYHHRHHVEHFGGELLAGSNHDYVDMHSHPYHSRLVGHSHHPHKIVSHGRPNYPKYQY